MPDNYAHYRMGVNLIPGLPADVRRTVQRFRRLYDVGQHGPDIFFYYNVLLDTATGRLGNKCHSQTGQEFFQRVCRVARLEKSEASLAYLYGVLAHYALDSVCHPYIDEITASGAAAHTEIEAEFDRFLLEKDGKIPPESQNLTQHLQLTPGESETVAKFYWPASARGIRQSVRNMAWCRKLLATPEGARRNMIRKGFSCMGPNIGGLVMPSEPSPKCRRYDEKLMELYEQAVELYPELLRQVQAHMTYNAPLDEKFLPKFG